jgi:hypothetical protein
MVKDVVRLPPEAREPLLALVHTGRAAAAKLLPARLLLKADVGARSRRWTAVEMAAAVDSSAATVHRVRQAWVIWGMETALSRKRPMGRPSRTRDGAQEAQLSAVACRTPPAGRPRGTLPVLADTLVALDLVATRSPECVRTPLKKTGSNRGSRSQG